MHVWELELLSHATDYHLRKTGVPFFHRRSKNLLLAIFIFRKASKRNDSHFTNKVATRVSPASIHQVAQLGSWKQAADGLYIAPSVRPMELIIHTSQNIPPCLLFSPTRFCLFIARGSTDACDTWASSLLLWPSLTLTFNINESGARCSI